MKFLFAAADVAAETTDTALLDRPDDGDVPAFQIWRLRIQYQFMADGPGLDAERLRAARGEFA